MVNLINARYLTEVTGFLVSAGMF